MIKKYSLLILLFVFGIASNQAQELNENGFPQAILKSNVKKTQINNKTYGTVLYSEDFDSTGNSARNGLPQGWTLQNNAGNSFNWIWSNTAPGGQYSTGTLPLQSTTGANGYLLLPSDLYNTPFPVGGAVGMAASVTSPQITLAATATVSIRFEQYYRYCCGAASDLVVEVSSDNINWTSIDITLGRSQSNVYSNPELMEFDVSPVLANQTTAYIRFRQTLASHYFFMVDDLEIIEGLSNSMALEDFDVQFFNGKYSINPTFKMIPNSILDSLDFTLNTRNKGSVTQQGVRGQLEVFHDSVRNGQSGLGLISQQISTLGIPVPFNQMDTIQVGPYVHTNGISGYYRAKLKVLSNATNQLPSAAEGEFLFEVTDSVMSKVGSESGFVGDAGPSNYVGGGNDGDRWGSMHSIGNSPATLKSVSIFVANVQTNIGASIRAQVWNWDDTSSSIAGAINPLLGVSASVITIDSTMLGTWINMPLNSPIVLAANSQILVGWEQIGGASSNAEFTSGRDMAAEGFQPIVSNFSYVHDSTPAWGWVTQLAAIQLNFDFVVAVDELENEKLEFTIHPNPSNGQFAIRLKTEKAKQYTLKVRNNLGQVVLEEQVSANGNFAKAIELIQFESGVYFLSLENEKERLVEKIIVQ
jgi:hypothetical protein